MALKNQKGLVALDTVKTRLLTRAQTVGVCDPSDASDPNFPDWRRHKQELILYGLLDVQGKITQKGIEALQVGKYRRSSKGKSITVSLDDLTLNYLDQISSQLLGGASRADSIRFAVRTAIKKLGDMM